MPQPQQMSKHAIESDCGQDITIIRERYNPDEIFTIPTVVHVIHRTDGLGQVSSEDIAKMLAILNQDFAGIPNGQANPSGIRFQLATSDPEGNPCDGITYTANDTWFEGNLFEQRLEYVPRIGWDYQRYMNIFITGHDGPLGFGLQMPWYDDFNPALEGVGLHYSVVSSQANDIGRVITHEVGHYFGLCHTFGIDFTDPCEESDCYRQGDRVCDTPAQIDYNNESCDSSDGCDQADPVENYMNYSPFSCQNQFTPEQVNRMRCTLLNWRPHLVNKAATSRWLPHIARIGGEFETTIFARNSANTSASIGLIPYDSNGDPIAGSEVTIDLAPSGFQSHPIQALFGPQTQLSHLNISGPETVILSMAYKAASGPGASAHLNEQRGGAMQWYFYPGEAQWVFDGLAILNTGSAATEITVNLREQDGTIRASKSVTQNLAPHAKLLAILNQIFEDTHNAMIEVLATQPIQIIALCGSQGGEISYLYQTMPTTNQ